MDTHSGLGAFVFALVVIAFAVGACADTHRPVDKGNLPTNARVIENLGNGWVVFELPGKGKFLYHRADTNSNSTVETVSALPQ